ncbi:MAG: VWA domain-containing protein [Planctomycetota bacterium]
MALSNKIRAMALLGALGAGFGAVGAEALFWLESPAMEQPARSICLLFDVSGSMAAPVESMSRSQKVTQLRALQDAATEFIRRQDLEQDTMALAVFAGSARVVTPLVHNPGVLQEAVHSLLAGGTTDLGRGLNVAGSLLSAAPGERWVVLFSDGRPQTSSSPTEGPMASARSAAARIRDDGAHIIAIGTGLADPILLREIAGSEEHVILSEFDALSEAFRRSEQLINRQMLAIAPDAAGFKENLIRAGLWAGLIATAAGGGLVVGQNRHLRRRLLRVTEAGKVVFGGAITGLAAGAAGQSLFYLLSSDPSSAALGRLVAWLILGCGLGLGLSSFVPNMSRSRAIVGGLLGGIIAAGCFLKVVPLVGEVSGRLLSAAILGMSCGLALVIAEAAWRKAWLTVHWGKGEKSTILLGRDPIIVGHARHAHIQPPLRAELVPEMARLVLLDEGAVRLDDRQLNQSQTLQSGETVNLGGLDIEIHFASENGSGADDDGMTYERASAHPGEAA